MKSILLSIKPEWLAKILNGEKTIEVRKLFPKDYVGWVYLYCSKDKKNYLYWDWYDPPYVEKEWFVSKNPEIWADDRKNINGSFNGKVVARFWCDKVEELFWDTNTIDENSKGIHWIADEDFEKTCLTYEEYENYLEEGKSGVAIHISKLEIFDRPRELREFWNCGKQVRKGVFNYSIIHKAPQNYCYIEGE